MTRRDFFLKWLFYGCATLLMIALQHLLLNRWQVQGVHPFVLPILAIMPATLESRQESIFYAIALGLICDLTAADPVPGFYTAIFLFSALVTSQIAGKLIMPGFLCAFLCGLLALIFTNLLHILFAFSRGASAATAFSLMGWELLLSAPLSVLIFPLYRKIYRRIRNE